MTLAVDLTTLSRRGFVAGSGAALAVPALVQAADAAAPAGGGRRLVLGVIAPTGTSFAGTGDSLVAGLRVGLHGSGLVPTVHRAGAYLGMGTGSACDELLAAGSRVVVASVSDAEVPDLAQRCAHAGAALVVANVGARLVHAPDPHVLRVSLQHWQSALSVGGWAVHHLGRTLFMIAAVPDAGYDTVFAVRRGFTAAGGRVLGQAETHGDAHQSVAGAVRAAKASGAKVVSVSATGRRAADILKALRRSGVPAAVVVDSLAVERFAVHGAGSAANGVHSVAAWTDGAGKAARAFAEAYHHETGHAPDAFAALGADVAALLVAGSKRLGHRGWGRLAPALAGHAVTGVRGLAKVHADGTVSTPLAVRRTTVGRHGARTTLVSHRGRVTGVPASMRTVASPRTSAYLNEYLGT